MRRDPDTDAPNFWVFARDYPHAYMPRARRLSPRTVQAYRISLECLIGYLSESKAWTVRTSASTTSNGPT
ncbi:hypothetical protein [Ornithinimicrobium sp. CNJ-824]|uniref:hypothetical protein n=1 Tax=Ornithinimicrobium sp. CNJ-824 TaxID=1904966 RepID=UPI00192D0D3E|nr:hypothetical protein [Ornithinimicrobium sp. CNJ-824]